MRHRHLHGSALLLLLGVFGCVRTVSVELTASAVGGPRETALQRLLEPLGIGPDELGMRELNYARDPWRLRVVDHLLARPLDAVAVVRGLADRLRRARESLADLIRSAGRYLDLQVPDLAGAAATTRPLADVLWALRADAVTTRADVERQVHRVPVPVQAVVADLLQAMAVAAPILREASASLSEAERSFLIHALTGVDREAETLEETETWQLLDLAARVDRSRLLAGATVVAAAVDRARGVLLRWRREGKPGLDLHETPSPRPDVAEGDVRFVAETVLGLVVVGGAGPTTYRRDAALIVDLGGDDRYENRAGGTADPAHPISIVIDLDGNDQYTSSADFAQGAAAFGVGILVDLGGHDTYVARDLAQGTGLFGVGLLVDTDGNDVYEAGAYAQGAGLFGVGALVDDAGDDRFRATAFAQGFGATGGLGTLLDEAGNDTYVLEGGPRDFRQPDHAQSFGQGFALGIRPLASGGIGLLADHAGDDRYAADYFAQGASYWLGLGALVDDAGDDRYQATRYAQGAGIHLSVGVLWDGGGNDEYRSWGVSQGCGHDLGVGILADAAGSDQYLSTWLSQGAGSADGIGLLLDLGGDDRFVAGGENNQGHGNDAHHAGSLGLFVKLNGSSSYSGRGRPDSRWDGFEYGGGLDARDVDVGIDLGPSRDPIRTAMATAFGPRAPAAYPRPPDTRFWPVDETARAVQALLLSLLNPVETAEGARARAEARSALLAMGPTAVPALVDILGSTKPVVAFATLEVLSALGEAAHPSLIPHLSDTNWLVRRRAASVLAETATSPVARILAVTSAADTDPVVRVAALAGIARAPFEGAARIIAGFLTHDPDAEVRVAAAAALAAMPDSTATRALTLALEDPAFPVRLAARKALASIGYVPSRVLP